MPGPEQDSYAFLETLLRKRGYPAEVLKEAPVVKLNLGFAPEEIRAGLVVYGEGRALLVADYAPGAVRSRERALTAYARLAFPQRPPPFVLQTNGREFALVETVRGREVAFGGPEILPPYGELLKTPSPPPVEKRRLAVEEKILFIHSTGG